MMTFSRLKRYVERHQSGDIVNDPAYRAYDLKYGSGPIRLRMALIHAGYRDAPVPLLLGQLKADLASCNVDTVLKTLAPIVQEWYVWQRLSDGTISRWKYRPEYRKAA